MTLKELDNQIGIEGAVCIVKNDGVDNQALYKTSDWAYADDKPMKYMNATIQYMYVSMDLELESGCLTIEIS